MGVPIKTLEPKADALARAAYQKLYAEALPGSGGIEAHRIEVATFNCAETYNEFREVGLGLETVVIYRSPSGDGHTGKVLMNLPSQLLPEHGHVDTIVLRREAESSPGFVPLHQFVSGFEGIRQYNADASIACDQTGQPLFLYRADDYTIVQAENGLDEYPAEHAGDVVAVFPGKSETFKAIHGNGILFADTAQVLHAPPGFDPFAIPEELLSMMDKVRAGQVITATRMIHLAQGVNVLLPKSTRHAFLAGKNGCVYLEFSTPSMDEADRFTDPRIVR
jgi:hypothetical protein